MTCKKRNQFDKCLKLLEWFPVLVILGARQVGKTTLAKQLGEGWKYYDLEKPVDSERIQHDPDFFFSENPENLILDEAQNYPELFQVLRGVVDADRTKTGRFILTGSSSPALLSKVSETLAGRVAIVELGTFKANELLELPLSPFYEIFQDKLSKNIPIEGAPPLSREQIQRSWFYGGYPEPVLFESDEHYRVWMENYRDTYINRDIARLFPKLNKQSYRRFLTMLCKLSGTIVNKSDIGRAIEASESSVRDYFDIAEGTFLWRMFQSYERSVAKSITKMPKGYIRDTGLMHYLLRITDEEELKSDPIVGASFEGYVCEEIVKGLQSTSVSNWTAHYFRTRGGAEVDLVLDGPFGVLPVEIKYGSTVSRARLRSLIIFVRENNLPFGMLINQSEKIEWLTPEVLQVPVGWV